MNVTLHIDGQSTEVDVPPDIIIYVVDADDDITDDEDALRHDLAESDNEDLINVDVDDVAWSTAVTVEVRIAPLHTMYPVVVWVSLLTEHDHLRTHQNYHYSPPNTPPPPLLTTEPTTTTTSRPPDGQSTEVDVPPNIIIDVVDEDDDITDDEDILCHDLAESHNEDLINVDDDSVDKMSADVARSYGGKGKRKPNLSGRAAGRLNTRDKTRNLSLKEITDTKGLVLIQFELRDKQTVMPLGDHVAHWSSYIGEVLGGTLPEPLKIGKTGQRARSYLNTDPYADLNYSGSSFRMRTDVYTVLPARATASPSTPAHDNTLNSLHKKVDFMKSIFKSYSKYSDMFSQFKYGGASGCSGCSGCGDEEEGADH
nr:F-box domain, leucine-rich repeat domain, L domain-like protein [Tanacetum cinerariifolium]